MNQVQYVTDKKGKQVGVLLDISEYQRLLSNLSADPDILSGLSHSELDALSLSKIAPSEQARLDELLNQNTNRELTNHEKEELNHLLDQVDQLTILKTRAKYTLTKKQLP